jgi:hypothetical protein
MGEQKGERLRDGEESGVMGRTLLGISDHGSALEDAREAPLNPVALPQFRRRTYSQGKGETDAGTLWRC